MVWLFVHFAPPWHEAQFAWKTSRALPNDPCGRLSERIVCTQVVSRSSASLAPCVKPWLKMFGLGGLPAKPTPPCTLRELLLKSVMLPWMPLQFEMRWSAGFRFEKKSSIWIVLRTPVAKIHVTPSARPSGWQEAQEPHASTEALPRNWTGSMSRIWSPPRPLSGVPSAVWKTSLPTSTACANVPGSGDVDHGRSVLSPVFDVRSRTDTEKPTWLSTYPRRESFEITMPSGMLPVWNRTTLAGAPMSKVPFASRVARSTKLPPRLTMRTLFPSRVASRAMMSFPNARARLP